MLKRYLFLLFIAVVITSCSTARRATSSDRATAALQEDIVNYGLKHLGKPYRYAGKGPGAFDCSGFTSFVYKKFGYNLGASSSDQDRQVTTIKSKRYLEKSDLVFFEGHRRNNRVGHVGIVVDVKPNGDFSFIHSSTSNGVIISKSTEPYYASRYLRGGRVIKSIKSKPEPKPKKKEKQIDNSEAIVVTAPDTKQNNNSTLSQNQTIIVQTDSTKTPQLTDDTITKNQQSNSDNKENKEQTQQAVLTKTLTTNIIHTVTPGETLYSIAKKYGCTIEQLRLWNPDLGSVLKAGDVLRIMQK